MAAALRVLCFLAVAWHWGMAGAVEPIPPLVARVTDRTGTLSQEQLAALEQILASFEARKGIQIAILVVPSTGSEPLEQFALRAAEQWKLGRKGVDDGALLVVAKEDRALRIEVGYGLEGALTDAASKRIISDTIVPHFRQGDFYGGIAEGVQRMMAVLEGEPLPPPTGSMPRPADGGFQNLPLIILGALAAGGVLRAIFGRLLGATATGGLAALLGWWLLGGLSIALVVGAATFLLTLFSGLGRAGSWRGGRGRRGYWGGGPGTGGFGGGGGFRGGGGGFGGGGASGRW